MFLAMQSPLPTTCPTARQALLAKRIIRDIGLKPHANGGVGIFTPSSYAKSLHIRPNVRFKACITGGYLRRRQKRSISQMAEADPSAIVSPRFAFSDRGAPGDFNVGFRFAGPIWRRVYSPSLGLHGSVGSPAALLNSSRVRLAQRDPSAS